MKYWLIYPFIDGLIRALKHLNLVEYFKKLFILFWNNKKQKENYSRIAVDVFIISKRIFIILLFVCNIYNTFALMVVVYLLIMNLFTYFYYHIRNQSDHEDSDIMKRGFINLFIAFIFSNLLFGYLYLYRDNIHFIVSTVYASLLYSFANSLTVSYDNLKITDNFWYLISISQVLITFVFVSLVIANSIPKNTKQHS